MTVTEGAAGADVGGAQMIWVHPQLGARNVGSGYRREAYGIAWQWYVLPDARRGLQDLTRWVANNDRMRAHLGCYADPGRTTPLDFYCSKYHNTLERVTALALGVNVDANEGAFSRRLRIKGIQN